MIDISREAASSINCIGLNRLRALGLLPYGDAAGVLEAINEVVLDNFPLPPGLSVRMLRLIATLEAHGLTKETHV